jgi:type VI secretion system protein ImpF
MSGRAGQGSRGGPPTRVQAPLLDRLIDDAPDQERDPAVSAVDSVVALRASVRRDLEALLNARRRWRSWPRHMTQLATSPLGYGIPDFASGAFIDAYRREELRVEIEETIRRFEPRFLSVRVQLVDTKERLDPTLRLRIEAVMHAEPAPEAVAFDTVVDPTTDEIMVRPGNVV